MARASELTPEQIRNLCVSFAQMGYFNTQFKSVMADAVIEKLGQFTPAVLADTAWAFGEANYYDFDLMANLLPYLKSNIEQFDASSMSKVSWPSWLVPVPALLTAVAAACQDIGHCPYLRLCLAFFAVQVRFRLQSIR